MRPLRIELDYDKEAVQLKGEFPDESDATQTIDEDVELYAPDGTITAVLLCRVIPSDLHMLAYELWKDVDNPISNRPVATGATREHRSTNHFGVPSPRTGTNERVVNVLQRLDARQAILGWDAKSGGLTKDTRNHPEMLDGNRNLIERVDELYAEHVPVSHTIQLAAVKMSRDPHYRRWHTAFSNLYILKNFCTACHYDTNNLRGVLTAIICCGKFTGGELVLPRWRIRIAYKPGDLLLFDPQQLHGNLPFNGERLSAAFYCARHAGKCAA